MKSWHHPLGIPLWLILILALLALMTRHVLGAPIHPPIPRVCDSQDQLSPSPPSCSPGDK